MLRVEDIHLSYGAVETLHGVTIEVHCGEIVAVLGANGAGKTTLLNTISGILKLNKGRIIFENKEIQKISSAEIVKLGIIHVPEGRRIFSTLTVKENLLLGAYCRKDKDVRKDLDEILDKFSILKERQNQLAGTLSGGEQQLLAIARGIIAKPKLLLLDEPSLGLSPKMIDQIFSVIEQLKEDSISILLVEQNARKALKVADRGYVIATGNILLSGDSNSLSNDENVKKLYLGK